ncbi:T9SS type A sorting domain-containing protein [bacterium]|nr:T9SS type A sorting domain-containing protein [bacterium]
MTKLIAVVFSLLLLQVVVFAQEPLPNGTTELFSGSGNCQMCHVSDGNVMIENERDVSPLTLWRSTMMANSVKDPLWQAKVSSESAQFPELQSVIESKCTRCHAPIGYTEAIRDGEEYYHLADAQEDDLVLDGVSCTVCHQIMGDNLGEMESFSGNYIINDFHQIYGPYPDPFAGPMVNMVGYTPVEADLMHEAALCGTCHTLFTPYLDDDNQIAGEFPEQTPYLEWLNSDYPEGNVTCQECHMPRTNNGMIISTRPPWLNTVRDPFWKHTFVGGNSWMLGIFADNVELLNLTSSSEDFQNTKERTLNQLTNRTVDLDANYTILEEYVELEISLTNLTGHKLPSGIPIRRMWLHVTAYDLNDQIIFESGEWDNSGQLPDLDDGYEPHHNMITSEDQVQVYEGIMGDVNQEPTWTLLRAAEYLKDNRLPPAGFTSEHEQYANTAIAGLALDDGNFNREGGIEGSGADIITYQLPRAYRIDVEVCFQSVNPAFIDHLAGFETPEVVQFMGIYENATVEPVILASVSLEPGVNVVQNTHNQPAEYIIVEAYPNPFNSTISFEINSNHAENLNLSIFNQLGQRVKTIPLPNSNSNKTVVNWNGLSSSGELCGAGTYFAVVNPGKEEVRKSFVLLK